MGLGHGGGGAGDEARVLGRGEFHCSLPASGKDFDFSSISL